MHVALYFHGRVPVRGYGGSQRVVAYLARGLAELGHRISLLALPGSRLPEAEVVPLEPHALAAGGFELTPYLPPGVDLLHAHTPLRRPPACPHLYTLHGNVAPGRPVPANTICVSADHARRHGRTTFVYNGIDLADYRFRLAKEEYDLFLGRLHRNKGYRWAMAGAKRLRRRLIVAGGWRPSLSRFVRFAGEVGGERKRELLAGAGCLWMPALWDEPFGLTLIEALASGTPVLGTRRGALPEVISPEVGALGGTLEELVALRPALDRLDPEACRARVERWFTHRAMAEEYLRVYRHYLDAGTLPAGRAAAARAS